MTDGTAGTLTTYVNGARISQGAIARNVSSFGANLVTHLGRSTYPETDASLQVNLVWSPQIGATREEIPPIPDEIAVLMREVSTVGKLVESPAGRARRVEPDASWHPAPRPAGQPGSVHFWLAPEWQSQIWARLPFAVLLPTTSRHLPLAGL